MLRTLFEDPRYLLVLSGGGLCGREHLSLLSWRGSDLWQTIDDCGWFHVLWGVCLVAMLSIRCGTTSWLGPDVQTPNPMLFR